MDVNKKMILRLLAGGVLLSTAVGVGMAFMEQGYMRTEAKGLPVTSTASVASQRAQMSSPLPARRMAVPAAGTSTSATAPSPGEELLTYLPGKVLHQGATTFYPVQLKMDDVLSSMLNGHLSLSTPDGSQLALSFDRHIEHGNGNWSWIGREQGGDASRDVVMTFGADASFGSLPNVNGNQLKLTTLQGHTYVASTPLSALHNGSRETDAIVPMMAGGSASTGASSPSASVASASAASAGPVVDVFIAYTSGYRAYRGGTSATVTAVTNMIAIGNATLSNSLLNGQYRLVGTMEVNYPDATDNNQALTDLQSASPSSPLAAVHFAREEYGADLVSLVRQYNASQNSCGVAYIMNAAHNPDYAYSEVSDGQYDENNGYYSYCPSVAMAHEIGHNLGAAHNIQISPNDGLFPYSHGYRDDTANFYDVMAYGLDGQTQFEIYATPVLTNCYSALCGNAATADVVRTLRQTMPIAANFRMTAVSNPADDLQPGQMVIAGTHRCLDVINGGTGNGNGVQMWDCNGFRQQTWSFGHGIGTFGNPDIQAVLDVDNRLTTDGTHLQIWNALWTDNQQWYFNNAALVFGNGRIMDAANYGTTNGTPLQLWDDLGGSNQRWRFDPATLQITNGAGRCLDIANYGTTENTPVQIWDCTGATNQLWTFRSGAIASLSGMCLQVANGAIGANGSRLTVGVCDGRLQQKWRIRGEFRSRQSDKCLDDPTGGASNGAYLQIWTCLGNSHQQWEYAPSIN